MCFKLPPAALASREPWVRVSARGNLKTNPRFNFENQIRAQRGFLSNLKSKTIFWEGNKIDGFLRAVTPRLCVTVTLYLTTSKLLGRD